MSEHNQQFDSFHEWVNKGRSWLTRRYSSGDPYYRAVCFDAKGRLVECGRDFMRARDEGAFPVRWLWPDQIAEAGNDHPFFLPPAPRGQIEEAQSADEVAAGKSISEPDTP